MPKFYIFIANGESTGRPLPRSYVEKLPSDKAISKSHRYQTGARSLTQGNCAKIMFRRNTQPSITNAGYKRAFIN